MSNELIEFLTRLVFVYLLMFAISILLAYFLSKYITQSISRVSELFKAINLSTSNDPITIKASDPSELKTLVKSYNQMLVKLEMSAAKLAANERESAWREMAKQVAHEIKNPLTPMRLTVQSFERRFDPADPNNKQKLKDYSNTLIEQIDVMSNIASTFSTYATMPVQKNEHINIPKVTKLALDLFNESYIKYQTTNDQLYAIFDRTQLIRVINNLVKNAIQAIDTKREPLIQINISHDQQYIYVDIIDNGTGIHPEHEHKIFEPKFTTKNSGMGLGLAMVKQIINNYNGTITMQTTYGSGTQFNIQLPQVV